MTVRYIVGDVRDVLASMPDNSVDLIMTSPPFLALRSYLSADHPDKHREIGSEPTPEAFLDTLLDLTEEWARVLTPHGSLCVELGDTYAGSNPGNDQSIDRDPVITGRNNLGTGSGGGGWPLGKSLCLVPQSYAWALSYGRNPFNGRETPPWRVRNIVRWCRPNPSVGALGDKFRPATSEMVVACKARDRWFDLDAVRTEGSPNTHARLARGVDSRPVTGKNAEHPNNRYGSMSEIETVGAPPLDYWEISTQPYSGSHYATFPEKLCVRPILSMCPREVCRECGEPRRRIVGEAEYVNARSHESVEKASWLEDEHLMRQGAIGRDNGALRVAETLGWSNCGHNNYRRGIVLDPFAGSGTTLAVAHGHGRDAIGIDLDARNAELAYERVGGMFLTVEHFTTEGVA